MGVFVVEVCDGKESEQYDRLDNDGNFDEVAIFKF